jgi:protein-tyrosine phosphatase
MIWPVIDLHCHLLPGVDDGPRTLEASIALCRVAVDDGTRTLVATSHVNGDYPDVTAAVIVEQTAVVNRAVRAAGLDLSVRTGAEVALSRAGELSDSELDLLTLGGGGYILLELPWTSAASGPMSALSAFAQRGYGIVLAHPERSPMLQRDRALVAELAQAGMLCCLDAASLSDRAERHIRSAAWQLLADGLVHAIASDCHDAERRPPRLSSMLARAGLSADQIEYFTCAGPGAILAGEAVPPPPPVADRLRRRRLPRPWSR